MNAHNSRALAAATCPSYDPPSPAPGLVVWNSSAVVTLARHVLNAPNTTRALNRLLTCGVEAALPAGWTKRVEVTRVLRLLAD